MTAGVCYCSVVTANHDCFHSQTGRNVVIHIILLQGGRWGLSAVLWCFVIWVKSGPYFRNCLVMNKKALISQTITENWHEICKIILVGHGLGSCRGCNFSPGTGAEMICVAASVWNIFFCWKLHWKENKCDKWRQVCWQSPQGNKDSIVMYVYRVWLKANQHHRRTKRGRYVTTVSICYIYNIASEKNQDLQAL